MTMMLSAKIDCAIVATRIGVVRRQAIDEIKRTLDSAPVVKLGFFATGEQAHEEYTGGYGYYYYSRGRAPGMREQPSAKGRSPRGVLTAAMPSSGGRQLIASSRSIAPEDRLDLVIHAAAQLPADVTVRIHGDGPLRGPLEALAAAYGIEGRVRFESLLGCRARRHVHLPVAAQREHRTHPPGRRRGRLAVLDDENQTDQPRESRHPGSARGRRRRYEGGQDNGRAPRRAIRAG